MKVLEEFITKMGTEKALAAFLLAAKITNSSSVGQVTAHINNGGVTQVCLNNWKVK